MVPSLFVKYDNALKSTPVQVPESRNNR